MQLPVERTNQMRAQEPTHQQHGRQRHQDTSQQNQNMQRSHQHTDTGQRPVRFIFHTIITFVIDLNFDSPVSVSISSLNQCGHDSDEQTELHILHDQHAQQNTAVVQLTCVNTQKRLKRWCFTVNTHITAESGSTNTTHPPLTLLWSLRPGSETPEECWRETDSWR